MNQLTLEQVVLSLEEALSKPRDEFTIEVTKKPLDRMIYVQVIDGQSFYFRLAPKVMVYTKQPKGDTLWLHNSPYQSLMYDSEYPLTWDEDSLVTIQRSQS